MEWGRPSKEWEKHIHHSQVPFPPPICSMAWCTFFAMEQWLRELRADKSLFATRKSPPQTERWQVSNELNPTSPGHWRMQSMSKLPDGNQADCSPPTQFPPSAFPILHLPFPHMPHTMKHVINLIHIGLHIHIYIQVHIQFHRHSQCQCHSKLSWSESWSYIQIHYFFKAEQSKLLR